MAAGGDSRPTGGPFLPSLQRPFLCGHLHCRATAVLSVRLVALLRAGAAGGWWVGVAWPTGRTVPLIRPTAGSCAMPALLAVGYCILLAEPLAACLQPLAQQLVVGSSSSSGSPRISPAKASSKQTPEQQRQRSSSLRQKRALAAAAALALLLACFSAKTVLRNLDWRSDEKLFLAAQKVFLGILLAFCRRACVCTFAPACLPAACLC